MHTQQPTLLIGPYDWDPARFPKSEFAQRAVAFWDVMEKKTAAVLVYADPRGNAELAYLTHYVPRLEPALALVPRKGAPLMLPSDPPNMWRAAKMVTWIEEFAPLGKAKETFEAWRRGPGAGEVAAIGCDAMPAALKATIADVLGEAAFTDVTPTLHALMRKKRPLELAVQREAAGVLGAAVNTLLHAVQSGTGAIPAVLEAEHTALKRGAQDVRVLFSRDGGRTLGPFVTLHENVVDPLIVYAAVRVAGYWADGFVTISGDANAAREPTEDALDAMLKAMKAGVTRSALAAARDAALAPYAVHPMAACPTHEIGLALEEPADTPDTLEEGAVYTLVAGADDGRGTQAMDSALVLMRKDGVDILWASP